MKFGESIWHCKRVDSGNNREISLFEPPYEIQLAPAHFSIQPASGYFDKMTYGEDLFMYQNGIAQPYEAWEDVFKAGDRVYLDGATPSDDDMNDVYAKNANYIVDGVFNQNWAIKVVFKKRTAK